MQKPLQVLPSFFSTPNTARLPLDAGSRAYLPIRTEVPIPKNFPRSAFATTGKDSLNRIESSATSAGNALISRRIDLTLQPFNIETCFLLFLRDEGRAGIEAWLYPFVHPTGLQIIAVPVSKILKDYFRHCFKFHPRLCSCHRQR